MKAGLLTIAALAASAAAQAHRRHIHQHARPDDVALEVVGETRIVYVDGKGNYIDSELVHDTSKTEGSPPAYQPQSPPPANKPEPPKPAAYNAPPPPPKPAAYVAPPPSKPAPPAPPANKPEPPKPQESKPVEKPNASSGHGIVYSPYADDGQCKTQEQIDAEFQLIDGYVTIRLYGTDCDQIRKVRKAACAKGMKLFLGIYDITKLQAEADLIIAAMKDDWSLVDTISVGNELINSGKASVSDVVAAVNSARSILRAAGYNGPVITVDTSVAVIANPELCRCSDYAGVNTHAFFDGARTADQAGSFVREQSQRVADACQGKEVKITETGWPWKGNTNGVAVPSEQNQKIALESLKTSFSSGLIILTAVDEIWKENFAGSHGAECHWGVIKHSG